MLTRIRAIGVMSHTRCSVDHCPNKTCKLDTSVSLFSIPVDESTLQKWIESTDYTWKAGAKVCSEHFADDDLVTTKNNGVRLRKGAIPTVVPAEYLGTFYYMFWSIIVLV